LMGCVLYLAYNRRRNIKDSMMVHMLNNSVSTLPIFVGYIWLYFR
ncbi:MAG: CPBP family intramembrane glutamate endopeptidase, partial [Staphylococcus epidermidis]|nr:CPBP family intramembrane glutamate endopeptidase [Staphylococcus epidermidis]